MKHLIVDTSTRQNWIALFEDDRLCGCLHFEDKQSCLINLTPGIRHLLDNAGWHIQQINRCSTVIGPGAWSSLRIGLATVKLLCMTNQIALTTLTSSQIIAGYAELMGVTSPTLLTALDAGGGKVYSAVFVWHQERYQLVGADSWEVPSAAALRAVDLTDLTIIGDGAQLLAPYKQAGWQFICQQPQADSRYLRYIAQSTLKYGQITYEHEAVISLKPLYVQPSSAEIEFKVQVT
ncbi:MAG TPA: tRNA (adenosine(37)-N6)-threonylcarbamoyltransferase complex dimerization subunit type 1 TsaB [Aggregatilineales bacterium]|nr:tRNA (adenosine(37)-N6)-threonylcarbamoyltransferase complex dimerization subunit type 1 TsaB [Aggregatilineales bacterium]